MVECLEKEDLKEYELIEKKFVTKKEFLEDTYRFESTGKVIKVCACEELTGVGNKYLVITDRTIFHPQGGG